MKIRTAGQARAELERKGISVMEWARANDLSYFVVSQVLNGRVKGTRGESHRAAVLLGMKAGELVAPDKVKDALAPRKDRQAA